MRLLVVGPSLGVVGWRARRDGTWLGLAATLVAPVGFAAESALYLDGFEWLSPLQRATRLAIIGIALTATATLMRLRLAPARQSATKLRLRGRKRGLSVWWSQGDSNP